MIIAMGDKARLLMMGIAGLIAGLLGAFIASDPLRNTLIIGLEVRSFEIGCHYGTKGARIDWCLKGAENFERGLWSSVEIVNKDGEKQSDYNWKR